MVIEVAYLRMYRPAEEVRLPVTSGGGDVPRLGMAVLTTESQEADAWEAEWNGQLWRCPRTPRRRMLESVVAHHRATERFGVGMIAEEVAATARRELARIRAGTSSPAPSMAAPWCPPLRWFVAFSPEDQVEPMLLRVGAETGRERLEEAAAAGRDVGLPSPLVDELTDLAEWVRSAEGGMLELDYVGVGRRLDPVTAALDDTVSEVCSAVQCLANGEVAEAVSFYTRAMTRWAPLQAIAYSS